MLEEITKQFWQASNESKACRINMKGEPLPRTVHPYGICRTTTNRIVLVCWQAMGFTKAGGKAGYRNLILKNCEDVEILDSRFYKRDDFVPADGIYKEWVYHI